ncbi:MAG: EamA family transporter [Minisyncoccia bacterium]
MSWFLIAFSALIFWSFVNISDQYLVSKFSTSERGSGGLVLFSSLIGVVVAVLIGVFTQGIMAVSVADRLLLMLTGGMSIAWVILYLYTLEIEGVSAVVPWFLTVPIFSFILGYFFLDETLTIHQLLGGLVIMLGAVIISIDFSGEKRIFKWKPALYMVLACLMVASSGVIFKFVTVGGSFWLSSFWEYAGLGIVGICLYTMVPKYRNEFKNMNKQGGLRIIILNTFSESFTIIGNLLTNYALLLVPVTMVYLVGSFQPAMVLVFTLIGTKFFPAIVNEDMSKKVLVPKVLAITIMILGSIILFV